MISKRVLRRAHLLELLDELEKTRDETARTQYLPPGEAEKSLTDIPPEIAAEAAKSPTGAAIFQGRESGCLVLPPFPITAKTTAQGFFTESLKTMLEHDSTIGLVLVRLGAYAVGISRGENLVTSKVGTGNIHGRHRQGGSSSHRFERHRDKQIETFLNRVDGHVREQLEPQARALDYIVYGGAWRTIQLLIKYCPFLQKLPTPVLPPLLTIPEPRQAVLEAAVKQVWSGTVIEWRAD
jgi:peptide subunit release factor 1 (eRF1)